MRLAISVGSVADGTLQGTIQYCKDLGVDRLVVPFRPVPGFVENGYLDLDTLKNMKTEIEEAGMSFSVMVYWAPGSMITGESGADAQFDNLCKSMEAMHEVGADTLLMFARLESPEDPRWGLSVDYYRKLMPQAEKFGVKIALHSGFGEWSPGAVERIMQEVPSAHNGVCFCVGNVWRAEGERLYDVIRRLGEKVFFVHLRNLRMVPGDRPREQELWFDSGGADFGKIVQALRDIDYHGDLQAEHMPKVVGENRTDIGTAWAIGYMKAALQFV